MVFAVRLSVEIKRYCKDQQHLRGLASRPVVVVAVQPSDDVDLHRWPSKRLQQAEGQLSSGRDRR